MLVRFHWHQGRPDRPDEQSAGDACSISQSEMQPPSLESWLPIAGPRDGRDRSGLTGRGRSGASAHVSQLPGVSFINWKRSVHGARVAGLCPFLDIRCHGMPWGIRSAATSTSERADLHDARISDAAALIVLSTGGSRAAPQWVCASRGLSVEPGPPGRRARQCWRAQCPSAAGARGARKAFTAP